MNKEIFWILGLGVAGFAAYEYFSKQQAATIAASSTMTTPVTTPQVSTGGVTLNASSGKYKVAPQLTQADINAISNYITQVYGFHVDPNGMQVAQPGSWNAAYNNVLGTSYDWNGAFDPSTYGQTMTFSQWYQVVQTTGSATGLGSIGTLRGWNNANVSRYELIAAGFPR